MGLKQSRLVFAAAISIAVLGLSPAFAQSPDAKKLVIGQCQQCHEIKGIPDFGNIGPSLVGLKARYPDRKDVVAIVEDETKRNPQTVMPPFGRNLILTKQEIESIVDYVYKQ